MLLVSPKEVYPACNVRAQSSQPHPIRSQSTVSNQLVCLASDGGLHKELRPINSYILLMPAHNSHLKMHGAHLYDPALAALSSDSFFVYSESIK